MSAGRNAHKFALTRFAIWIVLLCGMGLQSSAYGWDAVGHRLTAAVALTYLSDDKQALLIQLLQQHPRFQEDFIDNMPASVQGANQQVQQQWLLGQAAFWPDTARGLPEQDARRFNRPTWHYTDGAWVRGSASEQGNMYISMPPFADIEGEPSESIRSEQQAHNIVTALDFNTRILADVTQSGPDRAVALCWVLHLMGDIHQPMHAGSLYSSTLFATGDRGGNRINTVSGTGNTVNLHALWDRAISNDGVAGNLDQILAEQELVSRPRIQGVASDWTQWLAESRRLLLSLAYSDNIKAAVANAERQGTELPTQQLVSRYINSMQRLARQRLGLAGLRAAIWIENSL